MTAHGLPRAATERRLGGQKAQEVGPVVGLEISTA